jgi:IS6 family transposase
LKQYGRAAPLPDELMPATWHITEQYRNNCIEADHGRLKHSATADARAQTAARSTRVIGVGHAFVQNLRCGALRTLPGQGQRNTHV